MPVISVLNPSDFAHTISPSVWGTILLKTSASLPDNLELSLHNDEVEIVLILCPDVLPELVAVNEPVS